MESIRKANVSDSDVVATLILETGFRFLPLIFGPHVKLILGRLIKTPGTVYYLDNIYVLELDEGKVVGVIVCYPGRIIKKRGLKTAAILFQLMGFEFIKRLRIFRLVWMRNKISKNEFYISNIAIDKNYRGMGYGKKLMLYAEKLARESGFSKITLDVENTNTAAIDLYKRIGYVGKSVKRINIKGNKFVFVRMEKKLS